MTRPQPNSLYERADHDWYIEPEDAVEALFAAEHFPGTVLDPCCGIGTIPRTALRCGLNGYGSDLVERVDPNTAAWFLGARDFLTQSPSPNGPDNTVMNPPFGKGVTARAFIEKALEVSRFKVAAFCDVRFLGSEGRSELFEAHPPAHIWWIVPRPSCPPGKELLAGELKRGGGSSEYCWIVWRVGERPQTKFGWINRHTKKVIG